MAETRRYDIELAGCTPEPLMSYLKALGILRLVSEQKDKGARGWWKNDLFHLQSGLSRDALVKFFLDEYEPTPIVAPWAGGSGFFGKDNKTAVEALKTGTSVRVKQYREIIQKVNQIITDEEIGTKPRDRDKARLIRRYRSELPDEIINWIDAAMVLRQDSQSFAPLLGTGGNDGRLDFTQNFMQRIISLGLQEDRSSGDKSLSSLEQALYAVPARLEKASIGQFAPGRAGGPNATQGMEGDSTDNPWDFVLLIEGALLFAGAAMRRFSGDEAPRAAFPFTVRALAAGSGSSSTKDELDSRGELWVPLWSRQTTSDELRQLLGEGRADVSGRPARDGTDFARAVAGLGVDRGISGFSRVGFLKRSGKAFLASPLGRFEVVERAGIDLLREADPWLVGLRRAVADKNSPPRFASALRRIDSAIFDFCEYGGATFFQEILVALGAAEHELSTAEQFREKHKQLRPLVGLSSAWAFMADDGSTEFAVALALASIYDPEDKIGPLRANLEPVDWKKPRSSWAEKDRSVVWNAADLVANLGNVLQRRMMDSERAGCQNLPLAARNVASLDAVASFIAGGLDGDRIADLLWGLALVRGGGPSKSNLPPHNPPLPRAYALMKLLFLPRPVVLERNEVGRMRARLLRQGESGGIIIRPEPPVLPLLRGNRVGEACMIAARRLRASGVVPIPGSVYGRARDRDWRELDEAGASINPHRLAAALLIPIPDNAVDTLAALVIRSENIQDSRIETNVRSLKEAHFHDYRLRKAQRRTTYPARG